MSLIVFVAIYAIGDPVTLLMDPESTLAEREAVTRKLGLDRPLVEQYFHFLGGVVQGDLGNSYVHNIPALKLILQRLPATLELAFFSMFIAVVAGIPLGVWAGIKPDSMASKGIMTGSILGFSLPTFWVGLMMVLVFSIHLGWLPTIGRGQTVTVFGVEVSFLTVDGIRHLILPAVNMSLY
jgi:peptide/nickel transport system permease protein